MNTEPITYTITEFTSFPEVILGLVALGLALALALRANRPRNWILCGALAFFAARYVCLLFISGRSFTSASALRLYQLVIGQLPVAGFLLLCIFVSLCLRSRSAS